MKQGGEQLVTCYMCKGKGKRDYGMVAEGIYPDVEEYYKGVDICDTCNGTGQIKEETY